MKVATFFQDFELGTSEEVSDIWASLTPLLRDNQCHFEDFFAFLLGSLPEHEFSAVRKAMLKLDPNRCGIILKENFAKFYKSCKDDTFRILKVPDVRECFSGPSGKLQDEIPCSSFSDYYFVVSLCLNDSSKFSQLLQKVWGV